MKKIVYKLIKSIESSVYKDLIRNIKNNEIKNVKSINMIIKILKQFIVET